jgi:hypothetical protein
LTGQRRHAEYGRGDAPVIGPLMRRNADDAGYSWRKSWGWRDPETLTMPDWQDMAEMAAADQRWRARRLLFWLVCWDLGALAALLVVR